MTDVIIVSIVVRGTLRLAASAVLVLQVRQRNGAIVQDLMMQPKLVALLMNFFLARTVAVAMKI